MEVTLHYQRGGFDFLDKRIISVSHKKAVMRSQTAIPHGAPVGQNAQQLSFCTLLYILYAVLVTNGDFYKVT